MALGGSAPRRYAEALLDLAVAAGAVDEYRASFDALGRALDDRVLRLLRDPGHPLAQRLALVDDAARNEPADIRALLKLLVQKNRLAIFPRIVAAFGSLVDKRSGILEARITTAVELASGQRDEFVARLARASGKRIRATFITDPTLLGGAKVQVGDRLVDGSLRSQLESLRAQLAS